MDNTNGKKLLKTLKNINKSSGPNPASVTDMVWGEVTSIEPLKIKVDNRFEISEKFIILSAMCQESIIKIPTESIVKHLHIVPKHKTELGCDAHPHTHDVLPFDTIDAMAEIRLWRGLVVGDNVRMLRLGEGQKYYVLEREEGIPWYPTTPIADNR